MRNMASANNGNRPIVEVDVTIDPNLISTKEASGGMLGNRAEREEWFRDQAFGMFIHWGLDSLLGSVISHWMIGADKRLVDRFIREFPGMFDPRRFCADDYARLAKMAGMKYMLFTAKHHSGFCMFDTNTTTFNVMNTPFGRDIARELSDAFRRQGLSSGLYFSPYDLYWCHTRGIQLHFATPEVLPANNPELMSCNLEQMRELLTRYGQQDAFFFDGPPEQLKELAWKLQPETLVTRGEMKTPEQHLPEEPIVGAWEACFTMGDGWSYKPTNETYKSGAELIGMLIETRAKGGNLLLNVTPDSQGVIPFEQERLLHEVGLFLFFNDEAIYEVRPWQVTNEGPIWFTRAKASDTVYAFVTGEPWPYGERKSVTLRSVRATDGTEVEIVGQSGDALEHRPDADTKARWRQDEEGLHIDAMLCYRPYDNRKWPNPVVIRITHAKPA